MKKILIKIGTVGCIIVFALLFFMTSSDKVMADEIQTNTTKETATSITVGSPMNGTFMKGKDYEYYWYKLSIPEDIGNKWYYIQLMNYASSYGNAFLNEGGLVQIFDSANKLLDETGWIDYQESGGILERVNDSGSKFTDVARFEAGQDYYIRVVGSYCKGNYILNVTTTDDDNWGTFDKAEPVSCDKLIKGKLEKYDDVDIFSVTLPKDGAMRNIVLTATDTTHVMLADSNGIKLQDTTVKHNVTNNSLSVKGEGQKIFIWVETGTNISTADYTIKLVTQKKSISTLSLTKYKKGSKKIVGRTIASATVTVKVNGITYKTTSNENGIFSVNLKAKLKTRQQIKVTVAKKGYKSTTKKITVK